MLLKNRLNSAIVLLTLLAGVACGEDDATDETSAGEDAGSDDDSAEADDDAADDDGDDDATDDDAADDDTEGDDAGADDDAEGDDDTEGDDAGADDDAEGDDAGADDDAEGDDAGADDDAEGDDAGTDDDAGADDDVAPEEDAGPTSEDAGLPENGEACVADEDCNEGATCYEGVCVQAGSGLRFSLSWDALADLDLHVLAPNGDEIWWNAPVGGGGFLDVDDCLFDGVFYCVDEAGTHVESIFFEAPEAGDYGIGVVGFETGGEDVSFTIRVFENDVELDSLDGTVAGGEVAETGFTYSP